MMEGGRLFSVAEPAPDLSAYDVVLINSSAGKDSQAMLDYLVGLADGAGVARSSLVVVHADLGRVEWEGTAELAERQAAHYGLRFVKVSRPQGDLLDQIEARGMFPDAARRYCTSDQKRGQVRKVMTVLADEVRSEHGRRARILNCMGMRSEESPGRAKRAAFRFDAAASNGRRHVDEWLPIKDWTEGEVWGHIEQSGVEHHAAYDAGMPRLSCCFCVLASKSALVRAAQLRPGLAAEYARVEEKIGHRFRQDLGMGEIIAEAETGGSKRVEGWVA